MIGKADKLLATRTLSALVVICVVMSAFAGFMILGDPARTEAAIGDLIIAETYTIEGDDRPVDGNIVVQDGGHLIIKDASVGIVSNNDPTLMHSITVQLGGTITLDHGVITTYVDQIDPWPFLDILIDGGSLIATNFSELVFPGNLIIQNSATVSLTDTWIHALPETTLNQYVVGSGGAVLLDVANDGPNMTVSSSTLMLFDSTIEDIPEYPSSAVLAGNIILTGSSTLLAVNSFIGVDFGPALTPAQTYAHNAIVLSGTSHAYLYGSSFEPYYGEMASRAPAVLVSVLGADAYVYKWLNATVGDEYSVPVSGATVTARYTVTDLLGQEAMYFTPAGIVYVPQAEVLAYMGETVGTYRTTKADGNARIPYLTDILTRSGGITESQFVGTYAITGTIGADSSTQSFSFLPYPAMSSDDQNYEFTVSIEGLSALSPDQSRWLVVPLSLTDHDLEIMNMTYYHAGDVIVAETGFLNITNAVFRVVVTEPYEHTIYVDGKFVIKDSQLVANMPIEIIVKGTGTLEVDNSTLTNVMIMAREDSNIILDNAELNGAITTEWNSNALLTVTDSRLSNSPVLAGTSVGHFTDSWVPSVEVFDDAIAHIYRWINVYVQDGIGMPLPGADVSIRQYVDGAPGGSAVSEESEDYPGVARVKSEATTITAFGSTKYLGNYWINATYTVVGAHYTPETSVGVLPYSAPLTPNASFVVMQFEDVLSDLTFHPSPPPQVEFVLPIGMTNPSPGDEIGITASVSNDGSGYAWDVLVAFYDDTNKNQVAEDVEFIGSGVIPFIRPGETEKVTISWTAVPPVDPNPHIILAVADPNNVTEELNDAVAQGSGQIVVRSLPDLWIQTGTDITTSQSPVVVNNMVQVSAVIHNSGSNTSQDVVVEFYDDDVYLATAIVDVAAEGNSVAVVSWTPTTVALHTIKVAIDPANVIEELVDLGDTGYNNNGTAQIDVLDYPDLFMSNLVVTPLGSVPGGSTMVVTGMVSNLNPAPIAYPEVRLYYNYSDQNLMLETTLNIYSFTKNSGSAVATFSFIAPVLSATTTMTLVMIVNPTAADPIETRHSNNIVSGSVQILDVRPDLSISTDDLYVQLGGTNRTSETFGKVLTIFANVWNLGGSNATNVRVEIGVRSTGAVLYNHTIFTGPFINVSITPMNNKALVSTPWTVNLTTAGAYELWVNIDRLQSINEPNEGNNWAVKPFTITALVVSVTISPDDDEYKAGDSIMISATITYSGTDNPVKRLPGVAFELYDEDTGVAVSGSRTANQTTDDGGAVNVLLLIPSDISTGSYGIRAVVLGSEYNNDPVTTVHVSAAVSGGLFPWWVWVLIIVAVVGVVAGFFVYTYVYGLGKLVECGECGAFIPAASKRCPKCGVEFETGTMKCSECGAWIPAESAECPNCGVKFVGEAAAEEDYMERMRAQYEDQVVSKYRELARPELGRKYNDKTFEAWWRRQPGYISFEDWLAKEEEKKKEGPVPCPVCGTLNPKEATVCHKCGTVFAATTAMPPRKGPPPAGPSQMPQAEQEQPVQEAGMPVQQGAAPGAGAPRMVIRRPIDRKVVPKKIIKTPLGEEKTEGGENQ